MKRKLKSFFSVVVLECIRIYRNKYILLFLLLFPFAMIMILGSLSPGGGGGGGGEVGGGGGNNVAINYGNLNAGAVSDLISENIPPLNITEVKSDEEGINLLKNGNVVFYITFSQTQPVTANFYYDSSSSAGNVIKEQFKNMQNEYAYQEITEFLSSYGITVNDRYFHLIEFKPYNEKEINYNQRFFIIEAGTFLSIILFFGMAYTVARDNETGVYRQIAYTPFSINKYLLSKAFPYLTLGLFQSAVMLLIGAYYFNIIIKTNIFLILALMFLFVCGTVFLGLLISRFKYQIITAFLAMVAILLPVFSFYVIDMGSYPFLINALLNCFPLSPFINIFKYVMFNGVVKTNDVIFLGLQCAAYYITVLLILKKQVKK